MRGAWAAALLVAVAYAFYRGFRMPNVWSTNYYLVSMQDGFFRRSLIGTVLYPLGDLRFHYHFIASIQLAVAAGVVAVMVSRGLAAPEHKRWLLLAFFFSPFGGFFFHEVGYVDQLLFLLLAAALCVRGAVAAAGIAAASVLVHEAAILITLPLLVCMQLAGRDFRATAITSAAALAAFLFVYFNQTAALDVVIDYGLQVIAKADHQPRLDYLQVFYEPLTGARQRIYYTRADVPQLIGAAVIGVLALMAMTPALLQRQQTWLLVVCGGAIAAPLVLGFLGWDTYRWVFLSACAAAFLVFQFSSSRTGTLVFCMALLAFGLGANLVYFDEDQPRPLAVDAMAAFARDLPHLLATKAWR